MSEEKQRRVLPQSELDFSLMTTDPVWGKFDIAPGLKNKLKKIGYEEVEYEDKETGEIKIGYMPKTDELWDLLGFYTRDLRLANLSSAVWNDEINYVDYHLNLANDLLQAGMIESFLIALSRAATKLELSQSKGGFLRKNMNTFRQETKHQELEPPKKSLFGTRRKEQ